jgi:hypothetical protein
LIEVGMKVEAKYNGKGDYLPGTVTFVNRDDTFTILFKNNKRDPKVKRKDIQMPSSTVDMEEAAKKKLQKQYNDLRKKEMVEEDDDEK